MATNNDKLVGGLAENGGQRPCVQQRLANLVLDFLRTVGVRFLCVKKGFAMDLRPFAPKGQEAEAIPKQGLMSLIQAPLQLRPKQRNTKDLKLGPRHRLSFIQARHLWLREWEFSSGPGRFLYRAILPTSSFKCSGLCIHT